MLLFLWKYICKLTMRSYIEIYSTFLTGNFDNFRPTTHTIVKTHINPRLQVIHLKYVALFAKKKHNSIRIHYFTNIFSNQCQAISWKQFSHVGIFSHTNICETNLSLYTFMECKRRRNSMVHILVDARYLIVQNISQLKCQIIRLVSKLFSATKFWIFFPRGWCKSKTKVKF